MPIFSKDYFRGEGFRIYNGLLDIKIIVKDLFWEESQQVAVLTISGLDEDVYTPALRTSDNFLQVYGSIRLKLKKGGWAEKARLVHDVPLEYRIEPIVFNGSTSFDEVVDDQ